MDCADSVHQSEMQILRDKLAAVEREVELLRITQRDCLALLENTPDFIYIKDAEHRFTCVSKAFAYLTGHQSWHELVGKTDFDIFPPEHAKRYFQHEKDVIEQGRPLLNHEEPYYSLEGELRWVSSSKQPVINDDGEVVGLVGISKDITDVMRYRAKIEALARYDQLTGLLNRMVFQEVGTQMLAAASRQQHSASFLYIDLDNFKQLNDEAGHQAGDELLCAFGYLLKECTRESDIVARLGGDEFVVLASCGTTEAQAQELAERISRHFHRLEEVQSTEIDLGCSIGIARFPHDGVSLDDLIKRADEAMYQAKREGKHRVVRYGRRNPHARAVLPKTFLE